MHKDKKELKTKGTKNIFSQFLQGAWCLVLALPGTRNSFSVHGIMQRLASLNPDQTILTLTLGMSSGEEKGITGGVFG